MAREHLEFPKWLYHATAPKKLVADLAAQEALGPEWAESPDEAAAWPAPTTAPPPPLPKDEPPKAKKTGKE